MPPFKKTVSLVVAGLVTVCAGCAADTGGAVDVRSAVDASSTGPVAAPPRSASTAPSATTQPPSAEAMTGVTGSGDASRAARFPPGPDGLPAVIEAGPSDTRKVALTFDADMTPGMLRRLETGKIDSYHNAALIEVLRQRRVPATLFLTGLWMQQYPEVTRELAADPLFELGTHSWQHHAFTADCYGLPVTPATQMLEAVTQAQRLLDELAGDRSTKLFRFPGGCYDTAALTAIGPAGVTVVQFDVEGGDGFQPRPEPIVRTVLNGAGNGSIVVLHMNGANTSPRTADAVGPIVDQLRAMGYELTTVSDLFRP